MKYNHYSIIIILLIIFSSKCFSQTEHIYPNSEWKYELEKNPCNYLNTISNFVRDSMNTTGLMIIKSGKVVAEYGDTKEISYLASTRKSVLSMLYGKYVMNGTIRLDETLDELKIDDVTELLPIERQATVDDIINSRSGVYIPGSNPGSQANIPKRGSIKPGTKFVYNNWDFNVAGTILEQKTGKSVYAILKQDIADQIGFQDFKISNQEKQGDTLKSKHLAYHFFLSTRDMARIGYLMLRKGRWNNKQIIPEEWIKKSTSKVSDTEFGNYINGYSYMWWLYNNQKSSLLEGAYTATGAYGQFITVIPKLDMVIAHKTKNVYERITQIKDYDKLIALILAGEENIISNTENINISKYCGTYKEVKENGETAIYEIYAENGQLKMKGGGFNPSLQLCDIKSGIITISELGGRQVSLEFEFDDNGKILGYTINNLYLTKN